MGIMGFRKKQPPKPAIRQSLGVYIHVPFCRKKCSYCDFYSRPCKDESLMDRYVRAVERHFGDYFRGSESFDIDTVYFGGGTPSLLGSKRLRQLLTALEKTGGIAKGAEITVGCNPESVDKKMFRALFKAGVNRLSMGVQSAHDDELLALGRLHTFQQARQAVAEAKEAGFSNISLDLIYGLPGQTMEQWKDSVEQIIALEPQHISAYALKLEKGTPLYEENPELPSEDVQADMYFYAVERLEQAGFEQYEISNFAQKGYRSRHNSRYWDLSQYLGFGPSAHSFFGGRRFSFIADTQGYIDGVEGNGPLLEEAEEVASFHRHGEYIMLKLRTTDGVDEEEFYRRFRLEFTPYAQRLSKYIQAGYCQNEGGVWRLTPKGMMVSNGILTDVLESELL